VFAAMPGDIFVLRNAGNTCTHAEGSVLGSLEFCVAALQSKMVLVLGHTACGAIKGATATYLQAKSGNKPQAGILELFLEEKMSEFVVVYRNIMNHEPQYALLRMIFTIFYAIACLSFQVKSAVHFGKDFLAHRIKEMQDN
jgi:carbonic anhydrase